MYTYTLLLIIIGTSMTPLANGYRTEFECNKARVQVIRQFAATDTDYGGKVLVGCVRVQTPNHFKYNRRRSSWIA